MTTTNNKEHKKPNVPTLRFPEFEGEWEKTELGKIATGFDYGMNAASKQFDGENKYIRITDIDESTSSYNNSNAVSPDGVLSENFLVKDRDILLARTGASTGKSYLYKPKDGILYFAGFLIRANITIHEPYFILSQLHTNRYWRWVSIMSMRSGQPGINSQEFASLPIFITNLQEEKKITSLLSLLDERIATQSKLIEELKKLKKILIDNLLDDLNCKLVKFESLYSKAGEGGTPSTTEAVYYDNGNIPFIRIEDLKQKYLVENKSFISELGLQRSSAWLVPSNSVLYSNGATIGEISITTYPVCTKQGILGIVPKTGVNIEFLYYLMSSSYFQRAITRIVTEGTMKTAYLKDINTILCPRPSIDVQNRIVKAPSSLISKIEVEEQILNKFICQKQYLLRQMFI